MKDIAKAVIAVLIALSLAFFVLSPYVGGRPYIQRSSATNGTVNMSNVSQDIILIHDAGLTLNLTIALPPNPTDGQKVTILSVGGITTLALTASTGTINNAIISIGGGGNATWVYSKPDTEFYRVH